MSRDLSLKAIRIHGKRVRCQCCRQHDAVERFQGLFVCRKCLRPMAYGFLVGQMTYPADLQAVQDHGPRVLEAVSESLERRKVGEE